MKKTETDLKWIGGREVLFQEITGISELYGFSLYTLVIALVFFALIALVSRSWVNLGFVQEAGHRFFEKLQREAVLIYCFIVYASCGREFSLFIFRNYCYSEFMLEMSITRKFLCPWQGLIW
nr:hypothetical protein CFP56_15413 [Quercus suber]